MFDQDAFDVTVAYDGDSRLLDPVKLNRTTSQIIEEAAELGVENALIEFYVDSREYGGQVASADEPHKIHRADGPVRTEFCTASDTSVKFSLYPHTRDSDAFVGCRCDMRRGQTPPPASPTFVLMSEEVKAVEARPTARYQGTISTEIAYKSRRGRDLHQESF